MTLAGSDGSAEVALECGCRVDVSFVYEQEIYYGQPTDYLRHTGGKMLSECDGHGWHTTPEAFGEREQVAREAKLTAERAQWLAESKLGDYESALARIAYLERTVRDMRAALNAASGVMQVKTQVDTQL
jgi:hypothetical protein